MNNSINIIIHRNQVFLSSHSLLNSFICNSIHPFTTSSSTTRLLFTLFNSKTITISTRTFLHPNSLVHFTISTLKTPFLTEQWEVFCLMNVNICPILPSPLQSPNCMWIIRRSHCKTRRYIWKWKMQAGKFIRETLSKLQSICMQQK